MVKVAKIKPQKGCPYHLSGIDSATAAKRPVSIEKREDRITIILKGNAREKKQQLKITRGIIYGRNVKIKKLFTDVYELVLAKGSIKGVDLIMRQLRKHNIIAHHAYRPLGAKLILYNLTDRIMIKFVPQAKEDQIKKLLVKYKLKELYTSESLDNTGKTVVVEVTSQSGAEVSTGMKPPEGKNPAKIANLLEDERIVDTAEVSLIYRFPDFPKKRKKRQNEREQESAKVKVKNEIDSASKTSYRKPATRGGDIEKSAFEPKDTFFNRQWYLHFQGNIDSKGNKIAEDADVDAVKAWEILNGGGDKGIVIAIIDPFIDANHPDLINQLSEDINTIKEEFIFSSAEGEISDAALNNTFSHGTKCAGIALAEKNDQGIVGVAYGCKFLPVWLDMRGGEDLIIKCFEKVGKIAHVISFSSSPLPENMKSGNNKSLLTEKLSEVAKLGGPKGKGCVICVSAGNFQVPINGKIEDEGFVFHLDNGDPQNIDKGETIVNLYAANPDVIAVTASTSTGTIAAYTNFGNEVSVCAPSSNWDPSQGMTKLTAAGIYTTSSLDGDQMDGNGSYSDNFGGTSAAAPLVAGIAALVLSANDNLPAAIVKKILKVTSLFDLPLPAEQT